MAKPKKSSPSYEPVCDYKSSNEELLREALEVLLIAIKKAEIEHLVNQSTYHRGTFFLPHGRAEYVLNCIAEWKAGAPDHRNPDRVDLV